MSQELASQALRRQIRSGEFTINTTGKAMGFVQANLAIVPQSVAYDFLLFCQRNPKPCPLLEVVEAGSVEVARLAPGSDIRKDLPKYRVFRDGVMTEEVPGVSEIWQNDFVSFILGCSYSFEKALLDANLEVRHLTLGVRPSVFRTNIPCRPAGIFEGPMVVSMRPFKPDDAIKAVIVTATFPEVLALTCRLNVLYGLAHALVLRRLSLIFELLTLRRLSLIFELLTPCRRLL
jgi:uncharacterized protein YcsI (UPF0317 family)